MGGRRHDGRRRAAVEARRRRRSRPPVTRPPRGPRPVEAAVERVGAPMLSDCELLEQFPHAFDDAADDDADDDVWEEDLDPWDADDDLDAADEDDDLPDVVGAVQDALRAAVIATVEHRDRGAAGALVARGDRILLGVVVGAWLAKARRRHPQPDLPARAAAWVVGTLGEHGPAIDDAVRALGPTTGEALHTPFLRVPDDVLVARIQVLAAVVAVGAGGADRGSDDLLLADEHRGMGRL
ncbi:hypothetical protein [Actinomycetospora straminea]|uniref:Uncharacterized protein n=1 Tax=Actinomycetospora straminea TaxID=663607 RepID=A0ABP9F9Z2_9PSEU|nr:hypothetical protein [Actinomycetospora straminea]MDD7932887.1 hypothetical protein [Actinomycetospora straminea]